LKEQGEREGSTHKEDQRETEKRQGIKTVKSKEGGMKKIGKKRVNCFLRKEQKIDSEHTMCKCFPTALGVTLIN
jgi:hypothetical protein